MKKIFLSLSALLTYLTCSGCICISEPDYVYYDCAVGYRELHVSSPYCPPSYCNTSFYRAWICGHWSCDGYWVPGHWRYY